MSPQRRRNLSGVAVAAIDGTTSVPLDFLGVMQQALGLSTPRSPIPPRFQSMPFARLNLMLGALEITRIGQLPRTRGTLRGPVAKQYSVPAEVEEGP
jgi:hypothetical protein